MIQFFRKRPWIWIVVAFLILISAWVVLFKIAGKHRPEKVPLEHVQKEEKPTEKIE